MFPSHCRDQGEEEEKNSINDEILRAAQPVTSVVNFQDNDDQALRSGARPSSSLLGLSKLDETMIAEAPFLIKEQAECDLPFSNNKASDCLSRLKDKSQTTRASEIKTAKSSLDWRQAVGLPS